MGFSNLQHEQLVLNYARQHGSIRRGDVTELCRISDRQAKVLLTRLKGTGQLVLEGLGRGAAYHLNDASTDR
jgi:ATP-dependent DNA helicase RecG